ncbi:MAG: GWxTD domain-containing protein [Candidatus Aminicenantes bacterium]|nr:GWxTD domain-containing protein [Candidatus Aminicenantes bacterium]
MTSAKIVPLFVAAAVAAGCGVRMSPSRDSWYAQHYFIMQKFEQDAYKGLSAAGRLEFQNFFWASRSGLVKKDFAARMEYIAQNFKKENMAQPWNTDRARVYLLAGPPASIDYRQNDAWGMTVSQGAGQGGQAGVTSDRSGEDIQATSFEVWTYPFGQYFVYYSFSFQPPSKWKTASMGSSGGSRVFGQFETQNKVEYWSPEDAEDYKKKLAALKDIK